MVSRTLLIGDKISILSPINKVLETILHRRLVDYLEKYKLFNGIQFVFCKKHSTNFAITYLFESILEKLDCNNSICGIFLNLAKAFDCVNHETLLNILEHYGVRGNDWSYFVLIYAIKCNIP